MLPRVLCSWIIYFVFLSFVEPTSSGSKSQKQVLVHYFYFWFSQIVAATFMVVCQRYSNHFLCTYLSLFLLQEINYWMGVHRFFVKEELNLDGTLVEWTLLKTPFWLLFAVHIGVYIFCCFKSLVICIEIFRILSSSDPHDLDGDDQIDNSMIDELEGELARTNSEVIRQLRPVKYSSLTTDQVECCICSLGFAPEVSTSKKNGG